MERITWQPWGHMFAKLGTYLDTSVVGVGISHSLAGIYTHYSSSDTPDGLHQGAVSAYRMLHLILIRAILRALAPAASGHQRVHRH